MAPHSSIRAWRIPWTEEPDGLQYMGLQASDMTESTHTHLLKHFSVTLVKSLDFFQPQGPHL